MVGFLVLSIPVLLLFALLGKWWPAQIDRLSLRIIQTVFKFCLFIAGVKTTIIGEENVPTDRAVLYVGNHTSFYDILLTYSRVPRLTGFVAKISMKKIPLLSTWMKRLHCLFLDRTNIKEGLKMVLAAIEQIKSGISIFIFPEGTRCETPENMLPFKEGSFKIAEKSGAPIVPVTLVNASAIFEQQFPRIKKSHVVIEYGTPIYTKDLEPSVRKSLAPYIQNIIATTYQKNKELL